MSLDRAPPPFAMTDEERAKRKFLHDRALDMREMQTRAEHALAEVFEIEEMAMYPQYVVGGYIVDFANIHTKVAVELDGSTHLGKAEYDEARTKKLEELGWVVKRFTNERVFENAKQVAAEIEEAIYWRSQDLPPAVTCEDYP